MKITVETLFKTHLAGKKKLMHSRSSVEMKDQTNEDVSGYDIHLASDI